MSYSGKNPTLDWVNLTPKSAVPTSPNDGDIFYSDGTDPLAPVEGLWTYINGSWAQISTSVASSIFTKITLTPQSSDPGSPAEGMIFRADGTSRAEGLWEYQNGGWIQLSGLRYQEFTQKPRFNVRAASTTNVTLASQVENGDSFGGVTLVTGDLVLLKNQSISTENGVYIVNTSGAPTRHTSYDSGAEITGAQVYVTSGTNAGNVYFQQNTVGNIASDAQSWTSSTYPQSFTVPEGVYEITVTACGGGGGGAGGANGVDGSNAGGGGGGGGAGSHIQILPKVPVNPGDVLAITVGRGGLRGNSAGAVGGSGGNTTITGLTSSFGSLLFPGASGGGAPAAPTAGTGATTYVSTVSGAISAFAGGNGGKGSTFAGATSVAASAGVTTYSLLGDTITGGAAGTTVIGTGGQGAGGGGGAGSNFGTGGAGANGPALNGQDGSDASNAPAASYGAGGGGGSGGSEAGSRAGGKGGHGCDGYVRISWD